MNRVPGRFGVQLALLLATAMAAGSSLAAENYVAVRLPHGVQVQLPRNWEALSSNQRITLDSSVEARIEHLGVVDASHDLAFAANYYDESGKVAAMFNIRYYPQMDISQSESGSLSTADIAELDSTLKASITQSSSAFGFTILSWFGTAKHSINGIVALVSEYERSPLKDNGTFRVRLVRVFDKTDSFTVTVSYRAKQEFVLRPICDRIIGSIRNM